VRTRAHDTYAQWDEPMFGGMKVPDLETLDSYVTLILDGKDRLPSRGREMVRVEDRRFAGITFEGDESVTRVAGCIDAHEFFVDSTAHVYLAARTSYIGGVLNCTPRGGFGAGI